MKPTFDMKPESQTNTFERIEFLSEFPLFESLEENELFNLSKRVDERVIRRHQFIYLIDDPCVHLYFLYKGVVKVGTSSTDGREVIKNIIHPKAMFGEWGLLGEHNRTEFAQAMDNNVIYLSLKAEDFQQLMRTNFAFSMKVFRLMGKKLKNTEKRLESLVFQDARTRIIEFLKDNARNFGTKIGYEMLLKHNLTQQDIANFTGTSRQTVTSVLNDLRKSNQIHFKRKSILIRDMANLS